MNDKLRINEFQFQVSQTSNKPKPHSSLDANN